MKSVPIWIFYSHEFFQIFLLLLAIFQTQEINLRIYLKTEFHRAVGHACWPLCECASHCNWLPGAVVSCAILPRVIGRQPSRPKPTAQPPVRLCVCFQHCPLRRADRSAAALLCPRSGCPVDRRRSQPLTVELPVQVELTAEPSSEKISR
jgi:hypothetical protein